MSLVLFRQEGTPSYQTADHQLRSYGTYRFVIAAIPSANRDHAGTTYFLYFLFMFHIQIQALLRRDHGAKYIFHRCGYRN